MHHLPIGIVLLLSAVSNLCSAYTWPSIQYDTLEALLYEGRRSDGSNMASLVHPCRKRLVTLSSVGAEWLRFAFHDMATHNVDDGTGGLDGSIVYELDRPENFGLGFNQTLSDFENFPNQMVSRADIIALGAVFAVSSCGGPIIPFRGGRIDTFTGGATGTPEPQQDLSTLTESFRKQGFTQSEMIKLVACGHTMGGVRSSDFPELVAPGANADVPNIVDFDTTMSFDNKVVTEYLGGTTQNVLVISPNKTMVSDLRVFESDNNSTMNSLSSAAAFKSECQDILERMINVVPKGVTLTDEIALLPAKVSVAQLTVEKSNLVFKSALRLTQPINATVNSARTVSIFWCDRYGSNKDCKGATRSAQPVSKVADDPNISPVTLNLGYYFLNYNFIVPIDSSQSIAKFWFEVDEHDGSKATVYNNGGGDYVVDQDQVIFIPMMSHVNVMANETYTKTYTNRAGGSFTRSYNLIVGVRNETTPSRVYVEGFDSSIAGFPYALSLTADLSSNSSVKSIGGYKFYTGTLQSSGLQLTLDVHAVTGGTTYTQQFVQTILLDNTPYVAPGSVTNASTSSAIPQKHQVGWSQLVFLMTLSLATWWITG